MPKRKKLKGAGGRRPARQRTQVQHYTDDIPGTFTKKKNRGRGSDDDSGSSESESDDDSTRQQQKLLPHTSGSGVAANNDQGFEWNGLAAKHKRQRPTKSSKLSSTTTTNAGYNGSSSARPGHKHNHSGIASSLANRTMKLQELPPSPPPQNFMLPHTGSIAPILPLATTCPLARHSLAQQYPVVFGRGLGAPNPPTPPEWKHVPQHYFYFPEDYTTVPIASATAASMMMEEEKDVLEDPSMGLSIMENHRRMGADGSIPQRMAPVLKSGPWPVCRVVTSVCSMLSSASFSSSSANTNASSSYMAVGDSAGFVILTTSSGPRGVRTLARLNTSASRREHARQREIQSKIEQQCRHKPELLEQRSAFWATAKTPNAIESLTWVVQQQQQQQRICAGSNSMIIVITASEIECLKFSTANAADSFTTMSTAAKSSNQEFGGNQNCEILWTMQVAPTLGDGGGPRKNGTSTLLNGGECAGSCLELHHVGKMVLWNTWGVLPVVASSGTTDARANANSNPNACIDSNNMVFEQIYDNESVNGNNEDDESPAVEFTYDWPLLLMHNADNKNVEPADFVKVIPFQRQEEEETPPPVPIKRSPGRPPKKKPKPKVPVADNELIWTESRKCKCHAAIWDNNNRAVASRNISRHSRLIIAYSTAAGNDTQVQLQLALLVLTDDSAEQAAPECSDPQAQAASPTTALTSRKAQYAKVRKQISIPLTGGPRNTGIVPEVTIRQSPKGTYTLVAGSSGVRMYETETMILLRVYGENVSLHGKAMVWKSCFVLDNRVQQELYRQQQEQLEPKTNDQCGDGNSKVLGNNLGRTLLRQNRQGFVWMEQDNPLSSLLDDSQQSSAASHLGMITRRSSPKQKNQTPSSFESHHDTDDDEVSWLHQAWIVGIPHPFRGPKELQETLYFWQGPEKLPLFTLPLPHNCGGVQSIHPLTRQGDCSNSMWQKLMIATVHGECFELAPSFKSEFAGNMYNPGYCVIEDNIEFIEDEDELDKVMVEVPEELGEEEEEELIEELEVGVRAGGDIVDAELAEAIRLSLLESKHKSKALQDQRQATTIEDQEEDDSTVVVVKDDFDEEGEFDVIIPCEPEPFLRQKVLLDLEKTEKLLDIVDASAKDKSAKDAEFASKVIPVLPQSKFAHRRFEKQKSRIEQQDGPLLRKSPFMSRKPQGAAGTGDSVLNQPASKLGRGKRSKAGNLGLLLEASIVPELRQYMMDRDRLWVEGTGASLLEDAWNETAKCELKNSTGVEHFVATFENSKQSLGNAGDQEHCSTYGNRPEAVPVELQNTKRTSNESNKGEEPVIPNCMSPESSTAAAQSSGLEIAIIELQDFTDVTQQYSRTATIKIPLTLGNCGSSVQVSSTFGENQSKRERPAVFGKQRETGAAARCAACHGRMVVHICGKRALPVDFEALAMAEKEKQEREDAERKRLKIEKRKMAEVKRREAKRRKKEIERQHKLAKEEELRRKQDAEIKEARARMANIGDYLEAGSPEGRAGFPSGSLAVADGIGNGRVGASSVHLAIADAWKEHAQQFSSNKTTTDSTIENSPRARSDAVAALAIMAEGTTQPAGTEMLFGGAESAKGRVSAQEQTSVAAEQKRVVHGFFSQEDAYPQHLHSSAKQDHQAPFEASSVARRQKVLYSYQDAIASGAPTAILAPRASGTPAISAVANQSSLNSAQVTQPAHSPVKQPQDTLPQRNNTLSGSYTSAGPPPEASASRPYFGYTHFSGSKKGRSGGHTPSATNSPEAFSAHDARTSTDNASAQHQSLDDAGEPSLRPRGDSNWSKPLNIPLNWQAQAPALNPENGTPAIPNSFVKNS